jgi:hypothetical protein
MSWPTVFQSYLSRTLLNLRFRLVAVQDHLGAYSSSTVLEEEPGYGIEANVVLGPAGPSVSGEGLKLPDATTDHGSSSVEIVTQNLNRVLQTYEPGRLVQIYAYIPGTSLDEPIALGVIENLSKVKGSPTQLTIAGMGQLLAGRFSYATDQSDLFDSPPRFTRLTSAYTAGGSTLNVSSTAEWAALSEFFVRLYPVDGSEPFVLFATGRSGTQFTGVASGGRLGTTTADCPAGAKVEYVKATRLNAAYTSGDATVTVVTTTDWAEWDTAGYAYFRVYPSSGDPFVLRAGGRGVSNFTSCTSTGRFGTVQVNASSGNDVEQVDGLYGHPGTIAIQLLLSTGLATNGSFDVLPERCGLAIPQSMVDDFESGKAINITNPSSGSLNIERLVDAPVTAPLSFIEEMIAPFGLILTLRQGQMCLRVLVNPVSGKATIAPILYFDDKDPDTDIIDVECDLHGADCIEYARVMWTAGTDSESSSDPVRTRPSESLYTVDLTDLLYTNIDAVLNNIDARMSLYFLRPYSEIRLTLAGLRASVLCPGDLIEVTLTRESWPIQPSATGSTTLQSRLCVVRQVDIDWQTATVRVTAYHYSESA